MSRAALVCLLLLAACGKHKKDGSTCEEGGTAFLALSHKELDTASVDSKTRDTVESHVPAMRDSMVRACKEGHWAVEARRCFASAADDAAMESCYQMLTADQQAVLEAGFAPPKK
jgi:hypothetical protein